MRVNLHVDSIVRAIRHDAILLAGLSVLDLVGTELSIEIAGVLSACGLLALAIGRWRAAARLERAHEYDLDTRLN